MGDFDRLTVPELKEELGRRGLTKSGRKADLVARLLDAVGRPPAEFERASGVTSLPQPPPTQMASFPSASASAFPPTYTAAWPGMPSGPSEFFPWMQQAYFNQQHGLAPPYPHWQGYQLQPAQSNEAQALAIVPHRASAPAALPPQQIPSADVGLLERARTTAGKRRRTEPVEERRQRMYRKRPSLAVMERIERATSHRLFLIDGRIDEPGEGASSSSSHGPSSSTALALRDPDAPRGAPVGRFSVLGSTGNVYTVRIDSLPSCDCPDFQKHGQPCKHILFVYLRVLKVPSTNPLVWQAALLEPELREALGGAAADRLRRVDSRFVAAAAVRAQHAAMTGQKPAEELDGRGAAPVAQRPVEGDCPVCCEEFGREAVVWCRASCGNNVTCPMCRTPWQDPAASRAAAAPRGRALQVGGYANLGALQPGFRPMSLEERYPETHPWIEARGDRRAIARMAAVLRGER
eukprot:tig00000145_g8802.t1